MNFNDKQFKLGRFLERMTAHQDEFDSLPEKVEFINEIAQELKLNLKNDYLEYLLGESFNYFYEQLYESTFYYLVPEMDDVSIATRNFDDNDTEYVIYIEDGRLKIIDGDEKDELIEKIEDDTCDACLKSWNDYPNEWGICECLCDKCGNDVKTCKYNCSDEIIDVTNSHSIVKFGEERFAVLKSDRKKMTENSKLDEWINLYRIQNNSNVKNIMMNKLDIDDVCGMFNMSTGRIKLFE